MSRNRSPIRRQEPLPRVLKVPPKRPYDYTLEENAAKEQEKSKNFFENLKRKKTEQSTEQPPLDPKVLKMLKNLHNPSQGLHQTMTAVFSSQMQQSGRKVNQFLSSESR
jgi:hypothetical protein